MSASTPPYSRPAREAGDHVLALHKVASVKYLALYIGEKLVNASAHPIDLTLLYQCIPALFFISSIVVKPASHRHPHMRCLTKRLE